MTVRVDATGEASELSLDRPIAHAFSVRNGKVTRLETFPSRSEALEAVGLRE